MKQQQMAIDTTWEGHNHPDTKLSAPLFNARIIETLNDDDLQRLNALLPWMCFTTDSKGRQFGNSAWKGKRDEAQHIPDPRILEMHRLFDLSNFSILEVGCFEGIHTTALSQFAARVFAIDARIENVVKSIVRCNMFGCSPRIFVCDLEQETEVHRLPVVDLAHHVGVLYHLKDPVRHLFDLALIASKGMLLDTHYATPQMINSRYVSLGKEYTCYTFQESGRQEVFSGMYDHSKWLLLEDILEILQHIGFTDIRIYNNEQQRNGPRVTLYAARSNIMTPE